MNISTQLSWMILFLSSLVFHPSVIDASICFDFFCDEEEWIIKAFPEDVKKVISDCALNAYYLETSKSATLFCMGYPKCFERSERGRRKERLGDCAGEGCGNGYPVGGRRLGALHRKTTDFEEKSPEQLELEKKIVEDIESCLDSGLKHYVSKEEPNIMTVVVSESCDLDGNTCP